MRLYLYILCVGVLVACADAEGRKPPEEASPQESEEHAPPCFDTPAPSIPGSPEIPWDFTPCL